MEASAERTTRLKGRRRKPGPVTQPASTWNRTPDAGILRSRRIGSNAAIAGAQTMAFDDVSREEAGGPGKDAHRGRSGWGRHDSGWRVDAAARHADGLGPVSRWPRPDCLRV